MLDVGVWQFRSGLSALLNSVGHLLGDFVLPGLISPFNAMRVTWPNVLNKI